MKRYDLVILGGGPSAVSAAEAAALAGQRVAIVFIGPLMGYGLEGAFKSKSLFEIARAHHAVHHRWHLAPHGYEIDFAQLASANQEGAEALRGVHRQQLKAAEVELIHGRGRFVAPRVVEVEGHGRVTGEHFIIATGTRPRLLRGLEADGVQVMTSDEIVDVDRRIESLLVLGAGVIGCEFASIYASLGSRVVLVDTKERIFPHDDPDISQVLTRSFLRLGIEIQREARCGGMRLEGGQVVTDLGPAGEVKTQCALLAVGRTPNTDDLGLETVGVELDARGNVPVDGHMQTNVPWVYAIGDVGLRADEHDLSLVHVGEAEGRAAVAHMLGGEQPLDTEYVPFIVFTLPMVAGAGLTETEARARYGSVRVGKWANCRNHRSRAMKSKDGFVKLIVGPRGDDRVLGVRAVGEGVDTVVGEASVLIQHRLPFTHLLDTSHAHPSLSESLHGAARIIVGRAPNYHEGEEFSD